LIERLRSAIGSEYDIVRKVAGGGMGVVFEARHRHLDRRVALKVLRPELATAVAAERFLAEGRILARLSHPNIVPVYDAGEADGLLYLVMEYVEGESLADRLGRNALLPAEAVRLGHDLLGALEAAHALGVIHRDVKPANVFLREGRALLGDFGIARWQPASDVGYTTPGQMIGTPRYMSPEQRDGVPVSKRTDVYAAGLVIWEACTGARWPAYQSPQAAEWRRVPSNLVATLQRALALVPEERWADAADMRRALDRSARRSRWPLVAAGTAIVAVGMWVRPCPPPAPSPGPRGAVSVAVEAFRPESAGSSPAFGESLSVALRKQLEYPDFYVLPAGLPVDSALVQVAGTFTESGGRIRLWVRWAAGVASDAVSREGSRADWAGVAEELSLALVRSLWTRDSVADDWLPVDALPSNAQSFDLWLRAEQFFAQARWEEAYDAYEAAEQADPACLLCGFRLLDIDRWLDKPHARDRLTRLEAGIARFTPHYQRLIHAALADLPGRLDTLEHAAAAAPKFFLAAFHYGDELFHRGPLHGRPRSYALEHFRNAVALSPRFAPGWEHLTWLELSEGDSLSADRALGNLLRIPAASTGFSASLPIFLQLAYHWRFLGSDSARRFSRAVLARPGISERAEAAAGARMLMTADAPRGAVEFGGMLGTAWPDLPGVLIEGLLGQLYGYAALGRLDSVRVIGAALGRHAPDPALPLLAHELEAVLRAFDPDPAVRRQSEPVRAALDRHLSNPRLRVRAAWASGLLAIRSGDSQRVRLAREIVAPGTPLREVLEAAALGEGGDPAGAIRRLPVMPPLDSLGEIADPLLDAVVRLLRAEQLGRLGDRAGERSALLWHQHLQTVGHGFGPPRPGEIGWAVGTLARWRLAELGVSTGTEQERCAAWAAVARHWSGAGSPFGSRADSARRAATGPDCR
jgi:serine/threonine protein kinase/tetratricopeptide (TPR) repeat protein